MWRYPPLNQRIFISKARSQCYHSSQGADRPEKFKLWKPEAMEKALDAVIEHGVSIRRAALEYDVPRSTLGDRASGRVLPGSNSGPIKILSDQEETELVSFLRRCSAVGYPKTRKDVITLVQRIADSRGLDRQISNGWWEKFCARNPSITLRAPVPLSQARAKATDLEVLENYFDLLQTTMTEHDLLDKPCQIFNIDESGFPLAPKPPKGIHPVGERNAQAINSGNKSQITVLACISAGGHCLPPMVIWDRKTLSPELTNGEIPGTIYGLSENGWVDHELFDTWFHHHFLRYAPSIRPLLLLMDGHSSHYYPGTIYMAAKEKVILFVLPPNTTHLTQPLDKGCFGPLKMKWAEVCHRYTATNPGKVVNRFVFCKLLNEAWAQSMSSGNIMAGFKTTGIYPLDRTAIIAKIKEATTNKEDDLGFIPLCSLVPRALEKPKQVPVFTESELKSFQERYEAKTTCDNRYEQWVKMYHPGDNSQQKKVSNVTVTRIDEKVLIPAPASTIEKFFPRPLSPLHLPTVKPKSCGRVLTSTENLKILKEKEQKKEEEKRKKEENKRQREERKKQKEEHKKQIKEQKSKKNELQQRKTTVIRSGTMSHMHACMN